MKSWGLKIAAQSHEDKHFLQKNRHSHRFRRQSEPPPARWPLRYGWGVMAMIVIVPLSGP